MPYGLKDAELSVTDNMPGATASADLGDFDIGNSERGDFVAGCEILVESPALTTAELPNTETITVDVTASGDAAFATERVIANDVPLQLGAGGAGAAAGKARVRLPTDCPRYVRVALTNSGAGNPSAKEATASLVF